jgi:hypothetical protein
MLAIKKLMRLLTVYVKLTAIIETGTERALCNFSAFALAPGIASTMTRAVLGALTA